MCGYCIEQAFLNTVLKEETATSHPAPAENIDGVLLQSYAQESNFIMHCLKYAHAHEMTHEALFATHCRAIEELFTKPDSTMKSSLIFAALTKHYHAYRQFAEKRFDENTVPNDLYHPAWGNLYQPTYLFDPKQWASFFHSRDFPDQTGTLLERYHSWWVCGEGKKKNDLDHMLQETGVMDPIHDIQESEWKHFYDLFPAIYGALIYSGEKALNLDLIANIALTSPDGVPDFPGYDLWLQRKALLIMIHNKGMAFLMENIHPDLRPELPYFAFLKLQTVRDKKADLLEKLQANACKIDVHSEYYVNSIEYIKTISMWTERRAWQ